MEKAVKIPAPLAPALARHQIEERLTGELQVCQLDRPPLVLHTLHVPCACGRPLVGQEYQIHGDTLFIRGVCLQCGVQTAIFAPPVNEPPDALQARVREEITAIVTQVTEARQRCGDTTPVRVEPAITVKAAPAITAA